LPSVGIFRALLAKRLFRIESMESEFGDLRLDFSHSIILPGGVASDEGVPHSGIARVESECAGRFDRQVRVCMVEQGYETLGLIERLSSQAKEGLGS